MGSIVIRAACFAAVILLGYVLRRVGFFKEEDFNVLARIVLKITLPAAIVVSFAGKEISFSMLSISLLGFGFGVLYIIIAFLMNLRSTPEKRAFEILNLSGCNIGNFTLPFVQSFLGATGVITTSLFDTGNAVICLGGAFAIASMVQEGSRFSPKKIIKALFSSVPFLSYVIMIVLDLLHIGLPQPAVDFAQIISNANAFCAMLMIGVGFNLSGNREQLTSIVRMLLVRYGVALVVSIACFRFVPLALEYRQALAVLAFSPIASAAPPFTADLKGDIGLSSAVNSFSILISIVCIVTTLTIVL